MQRFLRRISWVITGRNCTVYLLLAGNRIPAEYAQRPGVLVRHDLPCRGRQAAATRRDFIRRIRSFGGDPSDRPARVLVGFRG